VVAESLVSEIPAGDGRIANIFATSATSNNFFHSKTFTCMINFVRFSHLNLTQIHLTDNKIFASVPLKFLDQNGVTGPEINGLNS
jgi:hypothetical protein